MNRRGFLTLLGLAPVALQAQATPRYVTGGYVRGVALFAGEAGPEMIVPVRAWEKLTLQVDTSAIAKLKEVQQMSDYVIGDVAADKLHIHSLVDAPDLTRHKLVYLGSPYTKYPTGLDAAFRDVAAIAAEMLQEGVKVYSPIAHTHPIAIYGNLDPRNHEIWLPFDTAMMDAADAMCIADMEGWETSYGVKYEIDTFRKVGKPVYFRAASGDVSIYPVAGSDS